MFVDGDEPIEEFSEGDISLDGLDAGSTESKKEETKEEEKTEETQEEAKEEDKEESGDNPLSLDNVGEGEESSSQEGGTKVAKTLFNILVKEGMFEESESESINEFSDLLDKFRGVGDSAISEYREGLPQDLKEELEAYEQGLDIKKVKERKSKVKSYKEYTDDVLEKRTDVAKELVRDKFKEEGMDDDRITKMLDLYEDGGILVEEAARVRDIRIKNEEHLAGVELANEKKRIEEIRAQNEGWQTSMKDIIEKSDEILGKKLSKKDKQEIERMTLNAAEVRKVNGVDVPVSYLQKALEEDPTILIHINYLLNKKLVGKEANPALLEKTYNSKYTEQIDKAMKGEYISGSSGKTPNYEKALEGTLKSLTSTFKNLKI